MTTNDDIHASRHIMVNLHDFFVLQDREVGDGVLLRIVVKLHQHGHVVGGIVGHLCEMGKKQTHPM